MLLPIFGFFFLGLPLLGAILAGILKNNFHANWVSAVVFIPSLLLQIPFCMVALCNDKQIFLNRFLDWLTFLAFSFFLPLILHFGGRFLTRIVRERLSDSSAD